MSATRLLCNDRSDDGILKRRIKTNDGPVTVDLKLAVPAKAGSAFQDKKSAVAAQATTLEKCDRWMSCPLTGYQHFADEVCKGLADRNSDLLLAVLANRGL